MRKSPLELEEEEPSFASIEEEEEEEESTVVPLEKKDVPGYSSSPDEKDQEVLRDRLGDRVIECVKQAPNFTIRPARLAQQLGISIDDASAELCGLLAAVGGGDSGAHFKFEEVKLEDDDDNATAATVTMVFTFPSNFERRCKAYRVKEELKETLMNILFQLFRIVRALISFGLILSIAVISVAAFIALIVAAVAMATGGSNNNNNRHGGHNHRMVELVSRFVQQLLRVVQQILMMYVLFGNNDYDDRGYHEHAHSMLRATYWLNSGMNPFWNPWFWASIHRSRMRRGWSTHRAPTWISSTNNNNPLRSYVPSRTITASSQPHDSENYRGALFIIMEFLFGPDDQWESHPTWNQRWQIRAMAIKERGGKTTLPQLLPYVDRPPKSIDDTAEAVWIISHFNGRPYRSSTATNSTKEINHIFCFPELMIDSENNINNSNSIYSQDQEVDKCLTQTTTNEFTWASFFFSSDGQSSSSTDDTASLLSTTSNSSQLPQYLVEDTRVMTKLSAEQFSACCIALTLNYFGSLWFRAAITDGTIFPKKYLPLLIAQLLKMLATFLYFYSKACIFLFLARLVVMMSRNIFIWKRNNRRKKLADDVKIVKKEIGPSATSGADVQGEFV
jgi:hypothetical protein